MQSRLFSIALHSDERNSADFPGVTKGALPGPPGPEFFLQIIKYVIVYDNGE